MAIVYSNLQNNEEYGKYIRKGGKNLPDKSHPLYNFMLAQYQRGMTTYFVVNHQPDSALVYEETLTSTAQKKYQPDIHLRCLFFKWGSAG